MPKHDTSPSKLRLFRQCPRRWKHAHIDKWRDHPGHAGLVGSIVHRVLEHLGKHRIEHANAPALVPAGQALDVLGQLKCRDHSVREEAAELLREALPIDLGQAAMAEVHWFLELGPYVVKMIVDRVDLQGCRSVRDLQPEAVHVTDYKTGQPQTREECEADPQLLYLVAAKEKWPWLEPTMEWRWIRAGGRTLVRWTPTLDRLTRARALRDLNAMQAQEDEPQPGEACSYCPYRARCAPLEEWLEKATVEERLEVGCDHDLVDHRDLIRARHRMKALASAAEARRKDLDKALKALLKRTEGHELLAGGLSARLVTRRLSDMEPALVSELAKATGEDPAKIMAAVAKVQPGRVKAWLKDREDREALEPLVEAHRSLAPSTHVLTKSGGAPF